MIIVLSHMSTCQGYVDPKFSSDMMLLDSDSTGDQGAIPLGTSDWCRWFRLGRCRRHGCIGWIRLKRCEKRFMLRIENATDTAPSMILNVVLSHSARASKCFIKFHYIPRHFKSILAFVFAEMCSFSTVMKIPIDFHILDHCMGGYTR